MITQHEIANTLCAFARFLDVLEPNEEYHKWCNQAKRAFQLLRNAFQLQ